MQNYKKDCITYFCCILLSLLFLVFVIPANTPEYPGYGMPASFLPNLATSIILFLSSISLLTSLIKFNRAKASKEKNTENNEKEAQPTTWKNYSIFVFFALAIGFLLLLTYVGFVVASALLILAIQLICGQRKILTLILVTTLPVGITYALMKFVLNVPIP